MKAVILAAGRGTRMKDLVLDTPKPLLSHKGKTLIEHKLEALPEHINEVVIVVGYLGDKIKNHFGESWNDKKIHYVEQTELLGTAHSLFEAKHLLDEPFIVLMGDDLYGKEDLELLAKQDGWAILVEKSEDLRNTGKIIPNEHGNLKEIVNDSNGLIPHNLVYTGACLLNKDIFEVEMTLSPGSKEYGLPFTIETEVNKRPIKIVHGSFWKRITVPEDLE